MGSYKYVQPCPELMGLVQCYWILDLQEEQPVCEPHLLYLYR